MEMGSGRADLKYEDRDAASKEEVFDDFSIAPPILCDLNQRTQGS